MSLSESRTADEMVQQLAAEYISVPETQLRQDVVKFLEELTSHGLVQEA